MILAGHVPVTEAVRARAPERTEGYTREITVGALRELDILAP
ncbi:hypothetical protein GCM10010344_01710 [Streptomyces bluensis]|nr:hypothetical protein GCM10010344_01710 [Streptomyces bluensis]